MVVLAESPLSSLNRISSSLPTPADGDTFPPATSPKPPVLRGSCEGHTYLVYFLHRLLDFRRADVEAVADMVGVASSQLNWHEPEGGDVLSPFWYLTLPSEESVNRICRRALLAKTVIELWGEGSTLEELKAALLQYPQERMVPYFGESTSIKVIVDGWGQRVSQERQVELIEFLSFLPFKGKIDLKKPDHRFWFIVADSSSNAGLPDIPFRMYFGREVSAVDRDIVNSYSLKSRSYLGPTSMDAEMAFLMCNQAKVQPGHFVLDPYVGTGSILVGAAHYGAFTLGTDIDVRVLRDGKTSAAGVPCDNYSNFRQYGLQEPTGLIRLDMHTPCYRPGLEELVDAVLADPPYGVRAGARKLVPKDHLIKYPRTHVPSTEPYCLGEVLRDLLSLSARLLKIGGRLVYFLPCTPETYKEEEVPQHPCMRLVTNSEQMLTTRYSRRLVTMEKVKQYDAAEAAAYHERVGEPIMSIDQIHDIVYSEVKGEGAEVNARRLRGKLL